MLSILIPTYNYNAFPLVEVLQKQAQEENIAYEIILSDDASTDAVIIKKNEAVLTLENCQYHYNLKNLGRGENRNVLCQKAKYPWILFLDCDTLPTASDFIKNYIDCFKNNDARVFYGGIAYQKLKPQNDELLRWVYGTKREAIPLKLRQKNPHQSTLVSNILVQKKILLEHPFHSSIYDYGYEDFVFISELKKNNIEVNQIDNPVYHLNLETSVAFFNKQMIALDNLHILIAQKIIHPNETTIGKWQTHLVRYRLDQLVVLLFNFFKSPLKKKIISNKPSLLLFDFYKLGYFCALKYS